MTGSNGGDAPDRREQARSERRVRLALYAVMAGACLTLLGLPGLLNRSSGGAIMLVLGLILLGAGAIAIASERRRRLDAAAPPPLRPEAAPRPAPGDPGRRAVPAPPVPLTVRSVKRGVEVTVDRDGITVKYWRAKAGGSGTWATHQSLPWTRIESLGFDSDWRDPAVSLYATGWGDAPRVHVVDSRKVSDHSWE